MRTAQQIRSAARPNAARRAAFRYAYAGKPCATCGYAVTWSRDVDSRDATRGTFGHILPHTAGGTYAVTNIIVQCGACQHATGTRSLVGLVKPSATVLPSQSATDAWRASGHDTADADATLPDGTYAARRAAFRKNIGW